MNPSDRRQPLGAHLARRVRRRRRHPRDGPHGARRQPRLFVALPAARPNFQPTDPSLVVGDRHPDRHGGRRRSRRSPGVQAIALAGRRIRSRPFAFDRATDAAADRLRRRLRRARRRHRVRSTRSRSEPTASRSPRRRWAATCWDLAWNGAAHSYAIVSDAAFNTDAGGVERRRRGTRSRRVYAPGGFSLADCERQRPRRALRLRQRLRHARRARVLRRHRTTCSPARSTSACRRSRSSSTPPTTWSPECRRRWRSTPGSRRPGPTRRGRRYASTCDSARRLESRPRSSTWPVETCVDWSTKWRPWALASSRGISTIRAARESQRGSTCCASQSTDAHPCDAWRSCAENTGRRDGACATM